MSAQNNAPLSPPQSDDNRQRLSFIAVYTYSIVVLSLSCIGLLTFYRAMRSAKFKLSSQLTIHIFLWLICGLCSLIQWTPIWFSLTTGEFFGRVGIFNLAKFHKKILKHPEIHLLELNLPDD
jgi:hypothetical protein